MRSGIKGPAVDIETKPLGLILITLGLSLKPRGYSHFSTLLMVRRRMQELRSGRLLSVSSLQISLQHWGGRLTFSKAVSNQCYHVLTVNLTYSKQPPCHVDLDPSWLSQGLWSGVGHLQWK